MSSTNIYKIIATYDGNSIESTFSKDLFGKGKSDLTIITEQFKKLLNIDIEKLTIRDINYNNLQWVVTIPKKDKINSRRFIIENILK